MHKIKTDIIVIGGGVAGLWIHHRLNDIGIHTILVDTSPIGGTQSLSSQGIIHGGMKYTLHGVLSGSASAISDMPKRWQHCLNGEGEIDLSKTEILSQNQMMWSSHSLSSKLTTFFSSKVLNGKISSIDIENYPGIFQNNQFKGNIYQLNEPVINVESLIKNLSCRWKHRILQIPEKYTFGKDEKNNINSLIIDNIHQLSAKKFILCAGEGNEEIMSQLAIETPKMQRRPLKMVLMKGNLPELYAHYIGANKKPIATITTHDHSDLSKVWYVGGNIAEEGIHLDDEMLFKKTKETLATALPWINLNNIDFATHTINRAEPRQKDLLRPDTAFVEKKGNIFITWPTKLALTPDLSDKIMDNIDPNEYSNKDQKSLDVSLEPLAHAFPFSTLQNLWERKFHVSH